MTRTRGAVSLAELLVKAWDLDALVGDYLAVKPSARIAHHRSSLLDALQREQVALDEAAERQARRDENARDRAARNWEPHQRRAAAQMGFEDPADWRRYIDEREAFRETGPYVEGAQFPTPEEWRAKRG